MVLDKKRCHRVIRKGFYEEIFILDFVPGDVFISHIVKNDTGIIGKRN